MKTGAVLLAIGVVLLFAAAQDPQAPPLPTTPPRPPRPPRPPLPEGGGDVRPGDTGSDGTTFENAGGQDIEQADPGATWETAGTLPGSRRRRY